MERRVEQEPARTSALPAEGSSRVSISGKFFQFEDRKLYLRGVTYGPFGPEGEEYPGPAVAALDLAGIRASGFNCVRTYTPPPGWFLDLAEEHGLFLLVGIAWEQHVAFLDDRSLCRKIERAVSGAVRRCSDRRVVIGYVLGNEIPASIVRWHGARGIERFVERLHTAAKAEDPGALCTYVNYPTTEYLQLPFLDFCSYNIYLESRQDFTRYLYRLQHLAGSAPLVIAELGLDALRNGEAKQATVLSGQIADAFHAGAAGCVAFSWTDEWYRGGESVTDWAFGLTTRERRPRPALDAVGAVMAELPFSRRQWPPVTVVVCVRNAEKTIERCLEGVGRLRYPDLETIVVEDGSNDGTLEKVERLAHQFGFKILSTGGVGLSAARNLGLKAASGEIVAYTDADAYPDPDWLRYLVHEMTERDYAAVGGPNLAPPGTGLIAHSVAASPGWPRVVLLSDREAEHIPGCNMAFKRKYLLDIGGFDAQFRTAGDDVDICWRLTKAGAGIGYSPAALVWHYPRHTVRGYWRQQLGYGRAETLLERKWPEKYDNLGQICWHGRIYEYENPEGGRPPGRRPQIYHGVWGTSLFQSLYDASPGRTWGLFSPWLLDFYSTPEWNMVALALAFLSALGLLWWPLLGALPILILTSAFPISRACSLAVAASRQLGFVPRRRKWGFIALTAFLHLLQPVARLAGRLGRGIRPLLKGPLHWSWPRRRVLKLWNEEWTATPEILEQLEAKLITRKAAVTRGGAFDRWDLEIQSGVTGSLRILIAEEQHRRGAQLIRLRSWPHWSPEIAGIFLSFALLSLLAAIDQAWIVSLVLGAFAGVVGVRAFVDAALAGGLFLDTIDKNFSADRIQ